MFRHRQNIKREEGETKLCAYIGILNDALHPRVPYIIRKEGGLLGDIIIMNIKIRSQKGIRIACAYALCASHNRGDYIFIYWRDQS